MLSESQSLHNASHTLSQSPDELPGAPGVTACVYLEIPYTATLNVEP